MDAVKPKRSRNPRARVNNKEAIMTALTGCSEEFLAPAYDQCTAMMKAKTGEKARKYFILQNFFHLKSFLCDFEQFFIRKK